eukprot:6210556-Pleurochrysis_carterae.AAC.4
MRDARLSKRGMRQQMIMAKEQCANGLKDSRVAPCKGKEHVRCFVRLDFALLARRVVAWPRATLSLTSSHSAAVCSVTAARSTSALRSLVCLQCALKAISCSSVMYSPESRPACLCARASRGEDE